MKLLMITNYFESHRGGLELIGGRLARELHGLGQEILWLACGSTPPPSDRTLGSRAITVSALNVTERCFGIPFPIPSLTAIWRIRREVWRSDAVLLHDCLYPMSVVSFLLARLARRAVLIVGHVGFVPYRNPVLRSMMWLANRIIACPMLVRADRVAFVSGITARYFSGLRFRAPPVVVFNGVDTTVFRPVEPDRKPELRGRLGLNPDRSLVLFVGRFVEKKGLDILLRMARHRPAIRWAFAGWGHLDPRAWGLPNVIVFSDLNGPSLAPLYQASDLLVLPSKGEGFPLVIQEALACGLPVVCSAETAGADAAVTPFLSAVPLDERNPEATALAFCAEIDRVLAVEGDGERCANERFQFVSQRYGWPACAARYFELIRSLPISDATRRAEPSVRKKCGVRRLRIGPR
jgi:glycosyltransferase involved in cell wall biosynthesis